MKIRLKIISSLAFFISLNVNAQIGNSLQFNGINNSVDLPSGIAPTNGTLEAWVKTTDAGSGFRGIVVSELQVGLFLNNNQLMSYNWSPMGNTGATTFTGATLNDNEWHHIVLTYQWGITNGSQLYLDGLPVGSPFTQFLANQPTNFRIGTNGTSGLFYNGNIDNVKIWNRVLTPVEINNTYNCQTISTTDLINNYNFDQGVAEGNNSGVTNLLDQSGFNNTGTLQNFTLNGSVSNWVNGLDCLALACPTPTGSSNQSFCNTATIADLSATGNTIQWYELINGGSPLPSSTPLVNGNIYYATQTTSICESETRLAVTATINSVPAPTGNSSVTLCSGATVYDLEAIGNNVIWYDAPTGGSILSDYTLLTSGSYYASQTIGQCQSGTRLQVQVTITPNNTPNPSAPSPQMFCGGGTVADLTASGSNLQWYDDYSDLEALAPGTALNPGTFYWVSQTISGCESDRIQVGVSMNQIPNAPFGASVQSFCNSATVVNLTLNGFSLQWYDEPTGGSPLPPSTILVHGENYWATQTSSGCESIARFEVTAVISAVSDVVTVSGNTLTSFQSGANYTWVDCNNGNQPIAGATAQTYTATANGSYAVIVELNGCSVTSNCVAITTVGLDDIKTELFRIYPNPASTVINVEMANASTVRMFDISGKLLKELNGSSNYTIDVTDLTPGMYMIESAEGAKAKFIKQ
mgnify:FL=1